ncbi:YcxB family protein [Kitasatospora sp. NPDC088346]|uniref:YcxB family protein n=1 Tax=Kitasatospora sp. NPDC088346 TaxID=3364073 RepID=UPI0038124714
MDITATFRPTEREVRRALRNLPAMRSYAVVTLALTALGLLTLLTDRPSPALVAIGPGILLLAEFGVVRLGARRTAPLLTEPWTVRITDHAYELTTPASHATVRWSMYRQVTGRAGFWYLQQSNRASGFLPQRAFDEGQRAELAAFFAATLPPVKRPWYRLV